MNHSRRAARKFAPCRGDQVKRTLTLCVTMAVSLQLALPSTCFAASKSKSNSPSGTLLLPLTPKIDTTPLDNFKPDTTKKIPTEDAAMDEAPNHGPPLLPKTDDTSIKTVMPGDSAEPATAPITPVQAPDSVLKTAPDKFSVEADIEEDAPIEAGIGDDTTLQGTIQIVADDTEFDQEKNTFLGTGNAVAIIGGQNSKLEADMILYDQSTDMIDARGNVRIIRDGQLTTGTAFKFKVASDEYLITNPDTEINGATVIARKGQGTSEGLRFSKGTLQLPQPFYLQRNTLFGPIGYATEVQRKMAHPDAYLPTKPSFVFKARKMVYEKYKDQGNLTVFGGKLQFGQFGLPLPKFTATISQDENAVAFPITPAIGNNLQIGGIHIGPSFNRQMGKTGILSWSPMVQIGGRNLDGTRPDGGNGIGLSGKVGFHNKKMKFDLAAGSVNHLMVGDFYYNIRKGLKLQSGINRFMEDGMYGFRRPRLSAELVDVHNVSTVPFISNLKFRTSAGAFQDNPQLVNLNPQYAKLFGGHQFSNKTVSAFKLQEQITAISHPIFSIGNDKYGLKSYIAGGAAVRAYSSGDAGMLGQVGPMFDLRAGRVRLQSNYTQSAVRGSTPFVFDQFIQGQRSMGLMGDVKVNKYLTLGGGLGYNLNQKLFYQKSITAAFGPEDFKVLVTRDMLRGMNRLGFDVLYGAPIPFDKLVLKGSPDHGQLGGI